MPEEKPTAGVLHRRWAVMRSGGKRCKRKRNSGRRYESRDGKLTNGNVERRLFESGDVFARSKEECRRKRWQEGIEENKLQGIYYL